MVAKTEKRIMFAATKEDIRALRALCDEFGETPSAVIRRALIVLHYMHFQTPLDK